MHTHLGTQRWRQTKSVAALNNLSETAGSPGCTDIAIQYDMSLIRDERVTIM